MIYRCWKIVLVRESTASEMTVVYRCHSFFAQSLVEKLMTDCYADLLVTGWEIVAVDHISREHYEWIREQNKQLQAV